MVLELTLRVPCDEFTELYKTQNMRFLSCWLRENFRTNKLCQVFTLKLIIAASG